MRPSSIIHLIPKMVIKYNSDYTINPKKCKGFGEFSLGNAWKALGRTEKVPLLWGAGAGLFGKEDIWDLTDPIMIKNQLRFFTLCKDIPEGNKIQFADFCSLHPI